MQHTCHRNISEASGATYRLNCRQRQSADRFSQRHPVVTLPPTAVPKSVVAIHTDRVNWNSVDTPFSKEKLTNNADKFYLYLFSSSIHPQLLYWNKSKVWICAAKTILTESIMIWQSKGRQMCADPSIWHNWRPLVPDANCIQLAVFESSYKNAVLRCHLSQTLRRAILDDSQ